MDLLTFYAKQQVIVYKPCACAIASLHFVSHIRNLHAHETCRDAGLDFAKFRVCKAANTIAECLKERYSLLDPRTQSIPRPLPTDPPLPDLKLHRGYQSSCCDFAVSRSKSSQRLLERHFNQQHRILPRKKGRPGRSITIPEGDKGPMYTEVYCQGFVASGHRGHGDVYRALIDKQLIAGNDEQDARTQVYISQVTKTEVSPWLEMTRWPRYFHGLNMADVALLAYAVNPITESALVLLGDSFNRLVEHAYRSVCEGRISVFDQAQINSFIAGRSSQHDRMIMVKLRKSTFRAYKGLWKCLPCFVYRTSLPTQSISLLHRFTDAQPFHLNRALCLVQELLSLQHPQSATSKSSQAGADILTWYASRTATVRLA